MSLLTRKFWVDAAERAAKTAAQSALVAVGAEQVNAWGLDYVDIAGFGLGGAFLSLLMSIASSGVGRSDSASFVA